MGIHTAPVVTRNTQLRYHRGVSLGDEIVIEGIRGVHDGQKKCL